mgnify:CR=1 FL=1
MICRKCKVEMLPGKALVEIPDGIPDFEGDGCVCTMSASGRAELIDVLKCPSCGFSVTGHIKKEVVK